MKFNKSHWLYLSAFISFLAIGISYWTIPYGDVILYEALLTPFLIVVIASALLLQIYTDNLFWRITLVIGSTVPATVIVRMLAEVVQDPTSHNLWPLEVVIALIIGLPCAAIGAATGKLVASMSAKPSRDG